MRLVDFPPLLDDSGLMPNADDADDDAWKHVRHPIHRHVTRALNRHCLRDGKRVRQPNIALMNEYLYGKERANEQVNECKNRRIRMSSNFFS